MKDQKTVELVLSKLKDVRKILAEVEDLLPTTRFQSARYAYSRGLLEVNKNA